MKRLNPAIALFACALTSPLYALAWNIPGHMLSGAIAYQILQRESLMGHSVQWSEMRRRLMGLSLVIPSQFLNGLKHPEKSLTRSLNLNATKILLSDYAFLYTLFWSGMRPSETIALRWTDVDLRAETAEITKSRHLGAEAAPKTRGSHRTVRLLPTVVELLSFIKPLHANENDYVFHDTMEKPLDAAQWRKRHWNKAPKS